MKKLWIAWEDDGSIRSRVLSRKLSAEYRAFTYFTNSKIFSWLRYPIALAQTASAILSQRPELLVVQNPSILLAFEAAVLKPLLGFRLIIDLHTLYIHPTGTKRMLARVLNNYGLNHCSVVIVTNETYRKQVCKQTEQPVMVLPDKIPDFDYEFRRSFLQTGYNVLYICTFASDEPWAEVIKAAELLPDSTYIHISGRSRIKQEQVPKNVIITGYLADEDYQNLLRSVDAVMVLTDAESCLVCGGYEAIAAGKPLILSDTTALKNFFSKGAIFTENRSDEIAKAVNITQNEMPRLAEAIETLQEEMLVAWERRWQTLLEEIDVIPEDTDKTC